MPRDSVKYFLILFLFLGNMSWAQNPLDETVSLEANDWSVEECLDALSDFYGIQFSYSSSLVPVDRRVQIRMYGRSLRDVMTEILGPEFEVVHRGSYVVIIPKKERSKEEPLEIEIKTKIIDASSGEPIDAVVYEVEDLSLASADDSGSYAMGIDPNRERVLLSVSKANYRDTIIELDVRTSEPLEIDLELQPLGEPTDISPIDEMKLTRFFVPRINLNLNQDMELTQEKKIQISFLPYLGTNGKFSGQTINKVSINILAGYAKGLDGFEFAGLANLIRQDMAGVQFAGFANVVGRHSNGLQMAGFANWTHGRLVGGQLAGFLNWSMMKTDGFQIAGGINFSDTIYGAQISAIGNHASLIIGPQITAVANVSTRLVFGTQVSAVANYANKVEGGQVTAVANIARDVDGFQASILHNNTSRLHGVQVGLFNYADTVSRGASIGLISWVRTGLHRPELSYDDLFPVSIRFVSGTEKFYNIFSIGARFQSEEQGWTFGYGFGTQFKLNERLYSNVELSAQQYTEFEQWTNAVNMVVDLNWNLGVRLGRHMGLHAGPVFRTYITSYQDPQTGEWGNLTIPDPILYSENGSSLVRSWVGYRITLRM
jgi:hypothetical protein